MTNKKELIEALEKCTRLQSNGGNGAQPFVRVYFEQPGDEQAFYSLISSSLSHARSADEQPTPPDDLVETVARAIWIGSGKRVDLWDNPPSPAWAAEMHQRKSEFIRIAQAVLQALSPHLSEREKIVTWLRSAQRKVLAGDQWDEGWNHAFDVAADAISRGDHISGETRND